MADPRFFDRAGPFTLAQLAQVSEAQLRPDADPQRLFYDVAPLESAGPDDVSFLENRRYLPAFRSSRAGGAVVDAAAAAVAPPGMALLVASEPYKGYALVARAFYPERRTEAGRAH